MISAKLLNIDYKLNYDKMPMTMSDHFLEAGQYINLLTMQTSYWKVSNCHSMGKKTKQTKTKQKNLFEGTNQICTLAVTEK